MASLGFGSNNDNFGTTGPTRRLVPQAGGGYGSVAWNAPQQTGNDSFGTTGPTRRLVPQAGGGYGSVAWNAPQQGGGGGGNYGSGNSWNNANFGSTTGGFYNQGGYAPRDAMAGYSMQGPRPVYGQQGTSNTGQVANQAFTDWTQQMGRMGLGGGQGGGGLSSGYGFGNRGGGNQPVGFGSRQPPGGGGGYATTPGGWGADTPMTGGGNYGTQMPAMPMGGNTGYNASGTQPGGAPVPITQGGTGGWNFGQAVTGMRGQPAPTQQPYQGTTGPTRRLVPQAGGGYGSIPWNQYQPPRPGMQPIMQPGGHLQWYNPNLRY